MNDQELLSSIPPAYADILPDIASGEAVKAGEALRTQYRDCAQGFRDLVRIAGSRRRMDALITPPINLGMRTHETFGDVRCSATISLSEYSPGSATEQRNAFLAITAFLGEQTQVGRKLLGNEAFGARGCNMLVMRMPSFVRIPDATIEAPWDQAESEQYDYDGSPYPWNQKSYRAVQRRLGPMIVQAQNTQAMLLDAMSNSGLNPQFADAASDLTVVRN